MGKGDHGDTCFAATNASVYTENETVLPSLDAMSPTIRNRHCSESNGPTQPIFIFGSMPSLGKSREKGHLANGIVRNVPLICGAEQKEVLLEKDGESCEEKEVALAKGQGATRRNLVLAILLLANLINYMDRYTIAGLLSVIFINTSCFLLLHVRLICGFHCRMLTMFKKEVELCLYYVITLVTVAWWIFKTIRFEGMVSRL